MPDETERWNLDIYNVPVWVRPALEAEAVRLGLNKQKQTGLTALVRMLLIAAARKYARKEK